MNNFNGLLNTASAKVINSYREKYNSPVPLSGFVDALVNTWMMSYHYRYDLVMRALKQVHQSRNHGTDNRVFKHADKLLRIWSKRGIRTTDDLNTYNEKEQKLAAQTDTNFGRQPKQYNHDSAMSALKASFGSQTNPLNVALNDIHDSDISSSVFRLAQKCAPLMKYPVEPLAKLFVLAHQLGYTNNAIVCATYQYAHELVRKTSPITTPAKYYLGILRHQISGDDEALASQLKAERKAHDRTKQAGYDVMPQKLVNILNKSLNANKYDGLVYVQGWNNYKNGWNARYQPKTLQGRYAEVVRKQTGMPDTGYPLADQLRSAVIICNTLGYCEGHRADKVTNDDISRAIDLSKRQCKKHKFQALLSIKPWYVNLADYIDLGEITDNDIKNAKNCLTELKTAELRKHMVTSFKGLQDYISAWAKKYPLLNSDELEYLRKLVIDDEHHNMTLHEAYLDASHEIENVYLKHKYLDGNKDYVIK